MTIEHALMTGVSATTTALVWAVTRLWSRSEECEKDRRFLHDEIQKLKEENGHANGRLQAFHSCPHENECPMYRLTKQKQ